MKNKINVNISPNPLDLQTLHCSQNDTDERKFYFTLHNNGEVIDATDISDPIFEPFDVYKGGTEQLLPVNTGVPTTSPIIADIQYPDEEKTEQEFTYRESPTTIDGKALIEKIKGNTIVWNQLCNNSFGKSNLDFTLSGNEFTFDFTSTTNTNWWQYQMYSSLEYNAIANHVYYASFWLKSNYAFGNIVFNRDRSVLTGETSGGYTKRYSLFTNTASATTRLYLRPLDSITPNTHYENIYLKNIQFFDLTQMFGAGNEPTAEQFSSLLKLPYYTYNTGTLLNFNGTGIKTVGFNQWDEEWEVGNINASTGQNEVVNTCIRSKNYMPLLPNTTYYFYGATGNAGNVKSRFYDASFNYLGASPAFEPNNAFTPPSDARYYRFALQTAYGVTYKNDICINISSSKNGTYEPYKESSLSLTASQYFPTGMKSAGTVYDEFTSSRAYTRVGEVDLGSLTWTKVGAISMFYAVYNTDGKFHTGNELPNIKTALYEVCSATTMYNNRNGIITDDVITVNAPFLSPTEQRIVIADTSYTDADVLKTALNGVMLQYELAVEEVTEFTHASLICEDGESALYHDDDLLVCECTEDFSKDSGFKDCKIKFSKGDGVVYSNKIQLHIERKP